MKGQERAVAMYLMRLDDAAERWDKDKWNRIMELLDKYQVKPIIGIIPEVQDPDIISKYEPDETFWDTMHRWIEAGWTPALHGYQHLYVTHQGGINPVNNFSEFAGVDLKEQEQKIRSGVEILSQHGITPKLFFAPAHTFDENTLTALKNASSIRVISDTIAGDVYYEDGFTFLPQQAGHVRKLPFKLVTFCYHPNTMSDAEYAQLEAFLKENRSQFTSVDRLDLGTHRKRGALDKALRALYFGMHDLRRKLHG